ncbi:MAG: disulfide bond formation protein B [Alphaproteobacteria bacterium]
MQRRILAAIVGIGVVVITAALVAQYGFGIRPCRLCRIERIPYVLAAVVAGLAMLPWAGTLARRRVVAFAAAAFAINVVIAGYHVGVERHWWVSATCGSPERTGGREASVPLTIAEMNRAIEKPVEMPCDVVQWSLFGLTFAGYNVLMSSGLAVALAWAAARSRWWEEAGLVH